MKLYGNYQLSKWSGSEKGFVTNLRTKSMEFVSDPREYAACEELQAKLKARTATREDIDALQKFLQDNAGNVAIQRVVRRPGKGSQVILPANGEARAESVKSVAKNKEKAKAVAEKKEREKAGKKIANDLRKFFSEFDVQVSQRFSNTMARIASSNGIDAANSYIFGYFELQDNPHTAKIKEKMKSDEWSDLIGRLSQFTPSNEINKRLSIYYGPAGTGKTTRAMKEADGNCVCCYSTMDAASLMEDFTFDDGDPSFHPSALSRAMTEGKPIVMDEMNLLARDTLTFLQGVLDGKEQFDYKGNIIQIKDGFKIIATMNLKIGGRTCGLTEYIVDRAETIEKFENSTEDILSSIL